MSQHDSQAQPRSISSYKRPDGTFPPLAGGSDQAPTAGGDGQPSAQEPTNGSPFAGVLDAVPQGREAVEAALKQVEGGITKRFQEAAEFRRTYEPYGELGLAEHDPQAVAESLAFGQLLSDPSIAPEMVENVEGFFDWWQQVGNAMGFVDDGGEDPAGGQEDPASAFQKLLDERLGPIEQRFQSQDQEQQVTQTLAAIDEKLEELQTKHGKFDRDSVLQFAHFHRAQGLDPVASVEAAHADIMKLVGSSQADLVSDKLGQPAPAVSGGRPDTEPEAITSFGTATEAARRRLTAQT